jgi:hypothetical protein
MIFIPIVPEPSKQTNYKYEEENGHSSKVVFQKLSE